MIELLIVLAAVVGVLAIMVPRLRWGRGARSLAGLRRYRSPDDLPGFLGGVLVTLAVESFCAAVGVLDATSVAVGVLVGIVWAVLRTSTAAGSVFLGATGSLGIIGSLIGFFSDVQCGGAALPARLVSLAVLAAAALVGALVAGVTGRLRPAGALAGYAAVEVLIFLASPLGISILDTSGWGVAAALGIAALFGFFAFVAPGVVIGLSAVAVAVVTLGVAATSGNACGVREWDSLAGLAAFGVCFLICSGIAGLVRR